MAYKHGIYGSEVATSLVPMTQISAGLPVVFGTAPVYLAKNAAKPNEPKLCYKYAEAVEQFGYSDQFGKYTLCEFMRSQFALYGVAPVVFVNVLDPAKHKNAVTNKKAALTDKVAKIAAEAILPTLKVKKSEAGQPMKENVDYTAAYDSEARLTITALAGGELYDVAEIVLDYDELDASQVTPGDVVGGIDAQTGAAAGLECVSQVYPKFGLVPGVILVPGFSHYSEVAAVMATKATRINGRFEAIALADISTKEAKTYTAVSEWKRAKNFVHPHLVACWPEVALGGRKYHLSTQLAGVICATDAKNDDVPYKSPSNESLKCDAAVTDEGAEVLLDVETAAYLNGQGVVTALNEGGWHAWGNRTSCYPSNTDVKDAFIPIRRMFCWMNNTLATTFWAKIDNPMNKRLIDTIVDSANIWLNGLAARGYILGGRVEFREDENTTTELMDGIMRFHVYFTPPSPARDIEFVQEYDPTYVKTLFED
ncbi:phage tail sheath family protein [Selenomonas sp. F0473]|uniref:phage tail sheath family protein n=1 Tax=Selenomonas sp. F0473 TaxID=999423 RepID=UPI0025D860ED|nr:phage tail sheath family protein [Selenomonas sp. F0473]